MTGAIDFITKSRSHAELIVLRKAFLGVLSVLASLWWDFPLTTPKREATRKENYAVFVDAAAQVFPSGLPETINGARFISFGEDWQPQEQGGRLPKPEKNTPSWVAKRLNRLLI